MTNHHTNSYDWSTYVYRRGFPIPVACPWDSSTKVNSIAANLRAGRSNYGRSTTEIKAVMGYEVSGWSIKHEPSPRPGQIIVMLVSPSDAIIGAYTVSIYVNGQYRTMTKFLLFFNPWCKDDSVYLSDDSKRHEYINNSHTYIYMGTAAHMAPRSWYLGQFQRESIEATLMLLDSMAADDRRSPTKVSRHFSALVNSNDDNGVISGNWSGNYAGGISPNAWTGSYQILAKYARNRSPVKFGQCWVYCGVLCSVLRTCGIPARCVTNYNSFHDHDGSLAWEMYYNRYFRPVQFKRVETMWNFHCWNEGWMDRPDLPKGNGGWQIIDGTPQERSDGYFKCGPASQIAVKEGRVELPYDTGFVFAEVNADKVYYIQHPHGGWKIAKVDSYTVGKNISTKGVGTSYREDITSQYKYPDNSVVERIIQNRVSNRRRILANQNTGPVTLKIMANTSVSCKEDCHIYFKFNNNSRTSAKVRFRVHTTSVSYRGRTLSVLLTNLYETNLKGMESKDFEEVITSAQLKQTIKKDYYMMKVDVIGLASGEHFIHSEATIEVEPPRISISGFSNPMHARQKYTLRLSLYNPLDTALTNAKIYVSGEVIPQGKLKMMAGVIPQEGTYENTFPVYAMRRGEFHVYATLNSDEVSGMERSISLTFH